MDVLQDYEVNDLLDNIEYSDRHTWEQTRLLMYQNIQMNTKKRINLKDVLRFKWDIQEEENKNITSEDIDRLKERANKISKLI